MYGKNVGALIIYRAINQTVMFEKADYIRIGSYTKKLNEYPTIQAQLWDKIVASCEILQLPAPQIALYQESTRVTLFAELPFSSISAEDK